MSREHGGVGQGRDRERKAGDMSAKAAVIAVNLETEECMFGAAFTDDGKGLDLQAKCEQFWKSLAADWPGWEPSYVLNEEARELMKERRMWTWGLSSCGAMADRIRAYNAELSVS